MENKFTELKKVLFEKEKELEKLQEKYNKVMDENYKFLVKEYEEWKISEEQFKKLHRLDFDKRKDI